MRSIIRRRAWQGAAFSASIVVFASEAFATSISSFDTTSEAWQSVGFQNVSNLPLFSSMTSSVGATFNPSGGNPGGYVSFQDPDGNWQYFSAPAAFLGNQSAAIGMNLTFDELIVNTFGQAALNPQGPLVAITNGTLTLVYGGGGATPPISGSAWNSLSAQLVASSWDIGTPGGAVASSAQFSSVMSSLTGLYILSDFWGGSGATGEIVGLDNVSLPTASSPTGVLEPATLVLFGSGLAGLGALRRRKAKALTE